MSNANQFPFSESKSRGPAVTDLTQSDDDCTSCDENVGPGGTT